MNSVVLHKTESMYIYSALTKEKITLPLIGSSISAGFPSPAEDFLESGIDLNKELIKNPSTTFYARVRGNSMIDSGIEDGDLLMIDRSQKPKNGKVALCYIDGDFTVKK